MDIVPGTFPEAGVSMLNNIAQQGSRVVIIVLVVTITIVALLWVIWLFLKSLFWPLSLLSRIPPLGELADAGVFAFFGKMMYIINVPMPFVPCHIAGHPIPCKLKGSMEAVGAFIKQFITAYVKDKNPKANEALQKTPGNEKYGKADSPNNPDGDEPENLDPWIKFISDYIKRLEEECKQKYTTAIDDKLSPLQALPKMHQNQVESLKCQKTGMNLRSSAVYMGEKAKFESQFGNKEETI
eukprot:762478-Hanusia_phi.AAC.15